MLYVTAAWLVPVSVTCVTFAVASRASVEPACAWITGANVCPFSSRAMRCGVGVLALKNFVQFVLIASIAALPEVGSEELAGADELDDAGALGAVELVVGVLDVLGLLL